MNIPMDTDNLKDDIKNVIEGISDAFDRELYAKTREELEDYYHFRWDDSRSLRSNTYQFWDMLSLYEGQCRQWEEHHFGHVCVVERVRDRYLLPKIDDFLVLVRERVLQEAGGAST